MFEDRPVRDGYVAFVAIMLVLVAAYCIAPRHKVKIVKIEAADSVAMRPAAPIARINIDGPRRLRKFGFSNYHIARIMYLRSYGYAFRSDSDLLALPHADTALVLSLAGRLDFSSPDSLRLDVAELIAMFRGYGRADGRQWRGDRPAERIARSYSPKVPLFAADSVAMAEAGMDAAAWDTLASYQRSCIIRGSMTLDSLVSISAEELALILRRRSSPRGFAAQDAVGENAMNECREVVDINVADREQLMSVRGIGEKTADAILDLRRRLGGFVSVAQIKDVWTLTPERFAEIAPSLVASPGAVKPVNVNSANDTRLRRHPYFPPLLAARIAQTRLRKNGAKLDRADVERCAEGLELSEFFWDYVAY